MITSFYKHFSRQPKVAWAFLPLVFCHILSVLEPRHLYRTDQKRPDGLTLVPWADGEQLLWDVTVVDSLAPYRNNAGSVCNAGTAAVEAEERKIDKYKDLVNEGYLFNN